MTEVPRDHTEVQQKDGTAKHLPFWSCFGGSFTSQHRPVRPKSAPASKADLSSVAVDSDESWRIGSQVPEPSHIQPIVAEPPLSNNNTPRFASGSPQRSGLHQVGSITAMLHSATRLRPQILVVYAVRQAVHVLHSVSLPLLLKTIQSCC